MQLVNMTFFRRITLANTPKAKRKPIIATLSAIGYLLLLASTILFTGVIPGLDSDIFELDGKITDAQNIFTQYQLTESMQWVPYNLVKLMDINPDPHPEIKLRLTSQMKITMMTSLSLLCWPETPSSERQATWRNMNFIAMENVKRDLVNNFTSQLNSLYEKRIETTGTKQFWLSCSTVLQILGLVLISAATSLQTLHKT